jgi:hypothetical protein
MAMYKMTVLFDTNEDVDMNDIHQEEIDADKVPLAYELVNDQPHINRLYEDVIERIETSPKHPITYDIVSFERLKEE